MSNVDGEDRLRGVEEAIRVNVEAVLIDFTSKAQLRANTLIYVPEEHKWWVPRSSSPAQLVTVSLVLGESGDPELQFTLKPEADTVAQNTDEFGAQLARVTRLRTTRIDTGQLWLPPSDG